MTTTAVDQAIDYIDRTGHVSFPELQRFAETALGMDARGDYCLEIAPNLILWTGVSDAFVDLVHGIQATRKVDLNSTSLLVYAADGGILNLPLAKRPPKRGYKDPHWAPVVFHMKPGHRACEPVR